MASIRVPAVRRPSALLALMLVAFCAACSSEEPDMPFKRVFRSSVENSENRGFMWVAKKAGQPDPDGRYEGGHDLEFHAGLGVCRMRHEGGVHPGKVFGGKCNTGYGHKEISSDEYDLLVARQDAFWHMTPKPGMELDKALSAGHEADGKALRLCVARHRTGFWLLTNHHGYHPGKYVHGKCNFGFGGEEVSGEEFYLFAVGSTPVLDANSAADGGTPDVATTRSPEAGTRAVADAASAAADPRGPDASVAAAKNTDAGAEAILPAAVRVASLKQAAPVRPVSCLKGEVACHCEKASGCSLEGYCPCSP